MANTRFENIEQLKLKKKTLKSSIQPPLLFIYQLQGAVHWCFERANVKIRPVSGHYFQYVAGRPYVRIILLSSDYISEKGVQVL